MNLHEFFIDYPKTAIAFSGGVDSAYLLYAAKQHAKEVCAYYVKSAFQPQFEIWCILRWSFCAFIYAEFLRKRCIRGEY